MRDYNDLFMRDYNGLVLQVAFLFTDAHVADEGFLELVNSMLTTGMPAALFDDAEKEALIVDIRGEVPPQCMEPVAWDTRDICVSFQHATR